jgi:hypothetical protein
MMATSCDARRVANQVRRAAIRRAGEKRQRAWRQFILIAPALWILRNLRPNRNAHHDPFYLGVMRLGQDVAAPRVFFRDGNYTIGDGNHRIAAAQELALALPIQFAVPAEIARAWLAERRTDGFTLLEEAANGT